MLAMKLLIVLLVVAGTALAQFPNDRRQPFMPQRQPFPFQPQHFRQGPNMGRFINTEIELISYNLDYYEQIYKFWLNEL